MEKKQPDYSTIDLDELLRQRRQIGAIWSIEDVQEVRPDLTEDQAWEVLQQCEQQHDCDYGITWATLEAIAYEMFPAKD